MLVIGASEITEVVVKAGHEAVPVKEYHRATVVVVGNDYPWRRHDGIMVNVQRELFKARAQDHPSCRVIISALPYLHAAWSEKKDLTEYMPHEQWEELSRAADQAEAAGYEPLSQALRAACVDWVATKAPKRARKPGRQKKA